ncbi:MAG: DUF3786 domain-containing protein [Planctomycetota bacterium]|jgi:hypothetical protein
MMAARSQSNKKKALNDACTMAIEALQGVDLAARCQALHLPEPSVDGCLRFDYLGKPVEINPADDWSAVILPSGKALHPAERLLALHYLQNESAPNPSEEWVTYRQFPGGQFYWHPFRNRTVEPLVDAIGDDVEGLQARLSRFRWEPVSGGDLGAEIHILGKVTIRLIYHVGDEEFPAEASVLFNQTLHHLFNAEDAAALASRVCFGLCNQACATCSGCGLCDAGPA